MKPYLAFSAAIHTILLGVLLVSGVGGMEVPVPGVVRVLLVSGEQEGPGEGAADGAPGGLRGGALSREAKTAPEDRVAKPPPTPPRPVAKRPSREARKRPPSKGAEARDKWPQRVVAHALLPSPSSPGGADGSTAALPMRGGAGGSASAGGAEPASGGSGERDRRISLIRDRIERALVYPREARRRGIQGTVHVQFDLTAAGRVRRLAVVRSSREHLLDRASMETVQRAQPFPYVDGALVVPVVFQLSEKR